MCTLQYYKATGRPPYFHTTIALLLWYTSGHAHKLSLEYFSWPSMSLLKKLRQGDSDAMQVAKVLLEISPDVILMLDEMHLQKCVQYSCGDFAGCNEDGNLFKGVAIFTIQGLNKFVPVVIKACSYQTRLQFKVNSWPKRFQIPQVGCQPKGSMFVRLLLTNTPAMWVHFVS